MPTEFLNPRQIIGRLELRSNMTAADFGSGSGGWVIPLAKRLEEGLVYAIDILKEPLSALESRAKIEKISNIRTIRADVESKQGSTLQDSSVDVALLTNLLFQVEDKKAVFEEVRRILKKGGKILAVDWKEQSLLGPKQGRILEKEVKNIAQEFGLNLEKEFSASQYHWGLIFSKP